MDFSNITNKRMTYNTYAGHSLLVFLWILFLVKLLMLNIASAAGCLPQHELKDIEETKQVLTCIITYIPVLAGFNS